MPPPVSRHARRAAAGALVGLAVGLLVAVLASTGLLEPLELKVFDRRLQWIPRPAVPREAVVVEIDQGSIDKVSETLRYGWPWPRLFYGKMLEFLAEAGARAVVFDMLFTEPEIDRDISGTESDAALVAATRAAGRVFHTGMLMREGQPPAVDESNALANAVAPLRPAGGPPRAWPAYAAAALPAPAYFLAARGFGAANFPDDPDGVTRRAPTYLSFNDRPVPAMNLAVAWDLAGRPPLRLDAQGARLGAARLPTDSAGRYWLWWYGDAMFERVPAYNVLKARIEQETGAPPNLDPALFRDRIVFIGGSASGTYDAKATPVASPLPGVHVQATALVNLLRGDALRRPAGLRLLLAPVLLALLIGLGGGATPRAWPAALLALVAAAGWCLAAQWLLVRHVFLDVVPAVAAAAGAFAFTSLANYAAERRHSQLVRHIFEHYLDRGVVQTLIQHPDRVQLGGERRTCTVLFSDVAGFTDKSEQMTPEQLVHFMNLYLDAMTEEILAEGGFVDKFVGDEIVAIFGAPNELPDHAARACRAVCRMQTRCAAMQDPFRALGLRDEVFFRAGLSTGEVVVGNMGSERRMNYTAMGDVMNLGARLESGNKQFGTRVAASEATATAAGDAFCFREVDRVRVKGKTRGVAVYELAGEAGSLPEDLRAGFARFAEALALYRDRRWEEAQRAFDALAAQGDAPAAVFAGRCRIYRENPPPDDWDGVFVMTAK